MSGWTAVNSKGARSFVASKLIALAYRIDPTRPVVTNGAGGGFEIKVGDIPIARVQHGQVRDSR